MAYKPGHSIGCNSDLWSEESSESSSLKLTQPSAQDCPPGEGSGRCDGDWPRHNPARTDSTDPPLTGFRVSPPSSDEDDEDVNFDCDTDLFDCDDDDLLSGVDGWVYREFEDIQVQASVNVVEAFMAGRMIREAHAIFERMRGQPRARGAKTDSVVTQGDILDHFLRQSILLGCVEECNRHLPSKEKTDVEEFRRVLCVLLVATVYGCSITKVFDGALLRQSTSPKSLWYRQPPSGTTLSRTFQILRALDGQSQLRGALTYDMLHSSAIGRLERETAECNREIFPTSGSCVWSVDDEQRGMVSNDPSKSTLS